MVMYIYVYVYVCIPVKGGFGPWVGYSTVRFMSTSSSLITVIPH